MAQNYDNEEVMVDAPDIEMEPSSEADLESSGPIGGYTLGSVENIDFGTNSPEETEEAVDIHAYADVDEIEKKKKLVATEEEGGAETTSGGTKDVWLEARNADSSSDWAYDDAA